MKTFSTEKEKMDVEFIHSVLKETYWNREITIENVKTCIENSLNFGLFLNEKQIGYARIVTDNFRFAALFDVIIEPTLQGNGYGKMLMDFIMNYPEISNIRGWFLRTRDAHTLYEKYGFHTVNELDIERIMVMSR